MVLEFYQTVVGSYFNADRNWKCTKTSEEFLCNFGWTTTKGQQSIAYSATDLACTEKFAEEQRENMPYVTQGVLTKFSTEKENEDFKPCVLHDYNIGKFGELGLYFRILDTTKIDVTVPVDALKAEELKHIKAGSAWYINLVFAKEA